MANTILRNAEVMVWDDIVTRVSPYVVKIESPFCTGTGFLLNTGTDLPLHVIATARHVIEQAGKWQLPLTLILKDQKCLYEKEDYSVLSDPGEKDLAILLVRKSSFHFESSPVDLLPTDFFLPAGREVGWLGYPADFNLCFFSGQISGNIGSFGSHDHEYLIDGVAISGVSGGPIIVPDPPHNIHIGGLITAYFSDPVKGAVLPGLSIAQDSSSLHKMVGLMKMIKSHLKT